MNPIEQELMHLEAVLKSLTEKAANAGCNIASWNDFLDQIVSINQDLERASEHAGNIEKITRRRIAESVLGSLV